MVEGYQKRLNKDRLALLARRQALTVEEYEAMFYEEAHLDDDGNADLSSYRTGAFALEAIQNHQRIYVRHDDD